MTSQQKSKLKKPGFDNYFLTALSHKPVMCWHCEKRDENTVTEVSKPCFLFVLSGGRW